jgi:pSer/pThr/pTyr-binding forkhead associated (FHA) protein
MLTRLRSNKEQPIQADIANRLTAVTGPIAPLTREAPAPPPPTEARLVQSDGALVAVLSCNDPEEIIVGRARGSGVRLLDLSVSRSHAAIRWDAQRGAHLLFDCGSANGTFIDGARIDCEMVLSDGALVRYGGLELRYLLSRPPE